MNEICERWGFSAERFGNAWYFWFKDQKKEDFFGGQNTGGNNP